MSLTAAMAIPALLAAAGTGAGMYMQNKAMRDAQRRQQREREYAMRVNRQGKDQQVQTTLDAVKDTTGKDRQATYEKDAVDNAGQFQQYLSLARPDSVGPGYGGKVSSDYSAGMKAREGENTVRAATMAGLMGRMNAVNDLYRSNALRNAEAAVERDITGAETRDKLRTSDLAVQSIHPSNTSMMLGDLLKTGGILAAGQIGAGQPEKFAFSGDMTGKTMPTVPGLGAGDFANMPSISKAARPFRGFLP